MMKIASRLLVASVAILSLAGVSAAQSPSAEPTGAPPPAPLALATPQPAECLADSVSADKPWMVIAPYGWIFGIQGTVGAGTRTAQVDASVSDTVGQLGNLRGAAQLHVETGYGPVGLITDLTYLRLVPSGRLGTVDSRSTLLEMLGMYRVVDTGREAGGVTFDVLAGARYYRFSNEISGNVLGLLAAERESSWIDLVVGARASVQVTDDLGLFVRGDVGGFGIGNSSSSACNVLAGFEYRCGGCASLIGGYRWFNVDRESGVGRDRFLLDVTMSGPFFALALRF